MCCDDALSWLWWQGHRLLLSVFQPGKLCAACWFPRHHILCGGDHPASNLTHYQAQTALPELLLLLRLLL